MAGRIFLDANILLEIIFRRTKYDKVVSELGKIQDSIFCISVLTADLVMYFVEAEKYSKITARRFLDFYEVLDMTAEDLDWAYENDKGDFEDALQIACAKRNGCVEIVTLDKNMKKRHNNDVKIRLVGAAAA